MVTEYKYSLIRKRFLQFCRRYNVSPEDLLSYCEGRVSNFPRWYADYVNRRRAEIRYRIQTGMATRIEFNDIWS